MGFKDSLFFNIHNAVLLPNGFNDLAMGIFTVVWANYRIIMCFKRGDTFGTTAFTSYGLFWLSLVGLIVMPFGRVTSKPSSIHGLVLLLWGIFTPVYVYIGSLCYPVAKQVVFGSLTILFFLLAAHNTGSSLIGTIAGFEGIFCGASAIYFAMERATTTKYGRTVLPVGEKKAPQMATQENKAYSNLGTG